MMTETTCVLSRFLKVDNVVADWILGGTLFQAAGPVTQNGSEIVNMEAAGSYACLWWKPQMTMMTIMTQDTQLSQTAFRSTNHMPRMSIMSNCLNSLLTQNIAQAMACLQPTAVHPHMSLLKITHWCYQPVHRNHGCMLTWGFPGRAFQDQG